MLVGGIANGALLERPKAIDNLDRVLGAEVDTAAQQLDSFYGGISIALRATARQADLAGALRPSTGIAVTAAQSSARRQRVEESLDYLQNISSLRLVSLTVFTPDGTALMTTGRPEAGAANAPEPGPATNPHISAAFWGAPGTITISKPLGIGTPEPVIAVATPVVAQDGRKVGVLEARTRLDGLRRSLGGRVYPTLLINAATGATEIDSRSAANERHARISSRFRSEKSARISSSDMPDARYSRTSYTVMRRPRMHGFPPRLPGSSVMTCR